MGAFSQLDLAPDGIACFRGGTDYSRHDLARRAEDLAALLFEEANAQGAGRWLCHSDDALASAITLLALARAKGCAVMAPNAQSETLRRLAHGVCGALVDPDIAVVGVARVIDPLARLQRSVANPAVPEGIPAATPIAEFQTSGTTGVGKSVPKERSHLEREVAVLEALFGSRIGPDASVFATVSPQHIYGLLFRVLWPIAAQRPFQAGSLRLPQELIPRMAERGACVLVTTPSFLNRMVEHPDFRALASTCRAVFSSGAPLERSVSDAVADQLGAPPIEILGSTETGGIAYREGQEERGGEWKAFPEVLVERDREGRLAVVSPFVSVGETRGDGRRHFVTGDLCELRSADGRFVLHGRGDRVVKIAGKRLALPAMEAELLAHPWVGEVALLTLDQGRESRVHAVIVPSQEGRVAMQGEGRALLREALVEHAAKHFDRVVLPRAWRFVAALPRDAQGKLPASALRALFRPRVEPALLSEQRDAQRLLRRLRVPEDLAFLDGHFPGQPMVPGVATISWVVAAANTLLEPRAAESADSPASLVFEVLKFPSPLVPGQIFDLSVEVESASGGGAGRVRFRLYDEERVFASGRFVVTGCEPGERR